MNNHVSTRDNLLKLQKGHNLHNETLEFYYKQQIYLNTAGWIIQKWNLKWKKIVILNVVIQKSKTMLFNNPFLLTSNLQIFKKIAYIA